MIGLPIQLAAAIGAPATTGTSILAHQGGWDEMLMVLGPIIVIAVVLRLVKRRIDAPVSATSEHTAPAAVRTATSEQGPAATDGGDVSSS